MNSEHCARQVAVLDEAVDALERGDWRSAKLALFDGGGVSSGGEIVQVACCLRCVTRGMWAQSVLGDVEAAAHQFTTADGILGRHAVAWLTAEPHPDRLMAHLWWRASRLVWRELADLAAIRLIFETLPRGRTELIHACVEYLTMVEFDPWTVQVHPCDRELTGLDGDAYHRLRTGNRRDICARATNLRQFAAVREGSVNERTWNRVGGYPVLREKALRLLAEEPVTRGRTDLPVRLGRLRAWEYARTWGRDTGN